MNKPSDVSKLLQIQPQKPYNVLGTLADQMTYPDEHADEISRESLLAVLEQVDLAHLLDREGVMDTEINWEDACSLGEKQRLAIARLIWHKPQFASVNAIPHFGILEEF